MQMYRPRLALGLAFALLLPACAVPTSPTAPPNYALAAFASDPAARFIRSVQGANVIDNRENATGAAILAIGVCAVVECNGLESVAALTVAADVASETTNGLIDRAGSATFVPSASRAHQDTALTKMVENRTATLVASLPAIEAEIRNNVMWMNAALANGFATPAQIGQWHRRDLNAAAAVGHLKQITAQRFSGLRDARDIYLSADLDVAEMNIALDGLLLDDRSILESEDRIETQFAKLDRRIVAATPDHPQVRFRPLL